MWIIVADKDKSPTPEKCRDWPRQGDRNTTGENDSIESSVAHKHMRRESGNINHNGDDETMLHCFFFKKRHVTLLHASGNRTFHSMIVHFYFSGKTRQKHNLAVMLIHWQQPPVYLQMSSLHASLSAKTVHVPGCWTKRMDPFPNCPAQTP